MTGPSESVGELLRRWRRRRRWSQLEFAIESGVSSRHISFVETGRTAPSRAMVLRLAECLGVPLRERNRLLVAAGYAPEYRERPLDAPDMAVVRDALGRVLRAHEPYPALAVDGGFGLVMANAGADVFLSGVDPVLLEPPVNMMRVGLHPRGMAPRIVNLAEVRTRLLARVARVAAATGDAALGRLLAELESYGGGSATVDAGGGDIALPIRIRYGGRELAFVNTIATFGTPLDITLEGIAVEAYFPADAGTAEWLGTAVTPPAAPPATAG